MTDRSLTPSTQTMPTPYTRADYIYIYIYIYNSIVTTAEKPRDALISLKNVFPRRSCRRRDSCSHTMRQAALAWREWLHWVLSSCTDVYIILLQNIWLNYVFPSFEDHLFILNGLPVATSSSFCPRASEAGGMQGIWHPQLFMWRGYWYVYPS